MGEVGREETSRFDVSIACRSAVDGDWDSSCVMRANHHERP
jgi:hypothetical protein